MKTFYKVAAGVIASALAGAAIMVLLRGIEGPRETVKDSGFRIDIEELSFYIKGEKIYGKVYRQSMDTLTKRPAIIFCHDIGRTADDCDAACRKAASLGYIGYCFDFAGGSAKSRSKGDPLTMSLKTEISDLREILKAIKKMPYVRENRVSLSGEGLGALAAAIVAGSEKRFRGDLILISPSANIPDICRDMYSRAKDIPDSTQFQGMTVGKQFFKDIRDLKPLRKMGGFKGRTLIVYGLSDPLVSREDLQSVIDTYPDAKVETIKGGHNLMSGAGKALGDVIGGFID